MPNNLFDTIDYMLDDHISDIYKQDFELGMIKSWFFSQLRKYETENNKILINATPYDSVMPKYILIDSWDEIHPSYSKYIYSSSIVSLYKSMDDCSDFSFFLQKFLNQNS